jgi:hypothetical protein
VDDRHQQRLEPGHRPPLPGFSLKGHSDTVPRSGERPRQCHAQSH